MNNIRGFMLDGDYDAIKKICEPFLDRESVFLFEIGTLYGKSAVAFDDSLDGVAHVILTLDTCSGWHGPTEEMMDELQLTEDFRQQVYANRSTPEEQFAEIQENIKDRPIHFLAEKWTKWYTCPAKVPNIVFYDGSHSYEETEDVLDYWFPKMSRGDVIAIDDYGLGQWDGLKEAVDEFCDEWDQEIVSYPDSKIVSITIKDSIVEKGNVC